MGTLYLVSTPIGNIDDITIRALQTLFLVDFIACEDTRVTGLLLELLKKKYKSSIPTSHKPSFISYREENEQAAIPELIRHLTLGKTIALVSDAGTPCISDPGYRIVQAAMKHNISVQVIPGVSAFLAALPLSGLPLHSFTFLGYLPEKHSKRITMLKNIMGVQQKLSITFILYVAPHKLIQTLKDMGDVFGNIPLVIARELTKVHEEFFRGTIEEAIVHFQNPKGEFILLFGV
jgi:16S rRNA (cytidine1402-2'-O)-methyltransferase